MKTLTTDIVVVGGGAAGLLAAAQCREAGREVVCVEATDRLGGSTSSDTGQLWLPATAMSAKLGGLDTAQAASDYLEAILGTTTPASSAARRRRFVAEAPAVADWLAAHGVPLAPVKGRVDFHPDAVAARRGGRVLATAQLDRGLLGPLGPQLRATDYPLELAPRSPRGLVTAARALAGRLLHPTQDLVDDGAALAGRLLRRAGELGVTFWLSTGMTALIGGADGVRGVRVRREGQDIELLANEAVLLCCGGFEGNLALRREHLPLPTDTAWTTGLASNTGAGIVEAARLGAQLATMNEAWWTVVARISGRTYRMTSERSLPHGIVVDSAGDRFFDEAGPVPEAGRQLYARSRSVRAVPSYLIIDNRHRQRYRLGPWLPGSPSPEGDLVRAQSLAELAEELRIDQAGLLGSVVRFNGFAAKGKDADFGRGSTAADRAHGDPLYRKNPCLGSLERSPFWAVRVYPGDAGTKGGVLTDADARVLSTSGSPIPGLYAVAGTAASLFKSTSPGPGAALASALVDAQCAVRHVTGTPVPGAAEPAAE